MLLAIVTCGQCQFAVAEAAEHCKPVPQAIVESAEGEVLVGALPGVPGTELMPGDEISVGAASRATLRSAVGSVGLRLDQNTRLTLACSDTPDRTVIDLVRGALSALARFPQRLLIRAPFANAAIEGTEFVVAAGPEQTELEVYEGRVRFFNENGEVVAEGGQGARARPGQKPESYLQITPRNRVQWTLHVPVAPIDGHDEELHGAATLLARGRLEEARSLLKAQSESTDGRLRALSLATEVLVDIAGDDRGAALRKALAAFRLAPSEPYVRIALSYALQANDRLRDALEALRDIREEDRTAALHARMSELYLGLGERARALDSARAAVQRLDGVSHEVAASVQSALGHALLASFHLRAALTAFGKAVALAPGEPRPRFGLGLALIRARDLEGGRVQLELAALLDPTNALYRNYLGRLYHEASVRAAETFVAGVMSDKLDAMANEQFRLAESVDPNDPTTAHNRAVQLRDANRPTAAIAPAREAMARNARRSVYRSRDVLERDLASRAVTLASLYQRVGFRELASIEAARAVELDPANDAAHEILSRINAFQMDSDVTAASEALQAQIFQPITRRPISLVQREVDLRLPRYHDLSEWSFGEYSSAFDANGASFDTLLSLGSRGQLANENQAVGVYGPALLSVGNLSYRTNGYRSNSHSDSDVYAALIQARVTPGLHLQSEFRRRESDIGDVETESSDDVDRLANSGKARETARIAFHHDAVPGLHVVGLAAFERLDEVSRSSDYAGDLFRSRSASRGRDLQFGLVADIGEATLRTGVRTERGFSRVWFDSPDCNGEDPFAPEALLRLQRDQDIELDAHSGYAYLAGYAWPGVRVVGGVEIESRGEGSSYFNVFCGQAENSKHVVKVMPKFGVEAQLDEQMRVRAAYFEGRDRLLHGNAALSPTSVMGFNQLYDDVAATYSKSMAAGLDWNDGDAWFVGVSIRRRRLDTPIQDVTPFYARSTQWRSAAYVHRIIGERGAVSLQPSLQDDEQGRARGGDPALTPPPSVGSGRIRTWLVPLTVRIFGAGDLGVPLAARKLFADIDVNYVAQSLQLPYNAPTERPNTDFVTVDFSVGMMLEGKRGMLALQAKNLSGERFIYREPAIQAIEARYPRFIPARLVQVVLALHWDD